MVIRAVLVSIYKESVYQSCYSVNFKGENKWFISELS